MSSIVPPLIASPSIVAEKLPLAEEFTEEADALLSLLPEALVSLLLQEVNDAIKKNNIAKSKFFIFIFFLIGCFQNTDNSW